MSIGALLLYYKANETAILSLLLIISELLGASNLVKANGFLSFLVLQAKSFAKKGGEKVSLS